MCTYTYTPTGGQRVLGCMQLLLVLIIEAHNATFAVYSCMQIYVHISTCTHTHNTCKYMYICVHTLTHPQADK